MSEWLPVRCPCGNTYNAGDLLTCPQCQTPSIRATPISTAPARSANQIDKCECGREYNRGRLAACPACGKVNHDWAPAPITSGAPTATPRLNEEASRTRKRTLWWIIGGGLALVVAVVLFGLIGSSPPPSLDAKVVRDAIQARDIPCEEASVSDSFGVVFYACTVAGEQFRIVIEEETRSNESTFALYRACTRSDQFATLIGGNWYAETSTPLVGLSDLQTALGGILTTGSEICPIVERVYFPEDYSQWNTIYTRLEQLQ